MKIHVGTSGYNYAEWKGTFYPDDLPTKSMFQFYSGVFSTVEINYTFYRMPTQKTTAAWLAQAPEGFTYALKAPQRITHMQKLKGAGENVRFFADAARVLGIHLGPLLFQLPPTFRCDLARLESFLAEIPADLRPAFEFRHDSWLTEEVYALLRARKAALCIADFGDKTTPFVATARHGYFRLRDEGYQPDDIARWADRILEQHDAWDDVFVYFKHEDEGKGPEFARAFMEVLRKRS
ncbi:MAG TPA: DUF72 domain-containing protein [Vicinamibacterales bacterium]|nr:DUF72 domain-containing protein [Vicinamibacterales bacterium]